MTTTDYAALLNAINTDPLDDVAHSALADFHEERGNEEAAARMRLQAHRIQTLPRLTEQDVEIDCHAEDEHMAPEDSFDDERDVRYAYDQLESGNIWGWCNVTVTVRWGDYEASDYLGGCSYASKADFTSTGGYCDGMVHEALGRLQEKVTEVWLAGNRHGQCYRCGGAADECECPASGGD